MKLMKKLLCCFTVMAVISSSLCVFAEKPVEKYNPYNIQLDDSRGIDFDAYVEANEELIELGQSAQRNRARRVLSVHHYYQDGQSWSNDKMQPCNKTIGSEGCCLTSFAMIANYYGCMDDEPGQVNTTLGSNACPFQYYAAASAYKLSIVNAKHETVSDSDAINFIIGAIELGRPVLVGMQKDYSSNTHFVVAYGYSGTTIYIHDPASNRNYTELAQYLSGYSVNRLYVYAR